MNRDERAAFGPRIKAERERLGMSQEELGEAAGGITGRTIGSYERGDVVPQQPLLERVLRALALSPEIDNDIDGELALLVEVIRPFLATLDRAHRAAVMPRLIEVLVKEMRSQIADEMLRDR